MDYGRHGWAACARDARAWLPIRRVCATMRWAGAPAKLASLAHCPPPRQRPNCLRQCPREHPRPAGLTVPLATVSHRSHHLMRMPLRGRLRDLLTAPSGVTGAAVETAVETSEGAAEPAAPAPRRAALLARLPLLALVFVGGMSSMSLEMCASRLMAPYFG